MFEGLSIDDGGVLAREPLVPVSGLADVKAVLQEVGKGTVSEGYYGRKRRREADVSAKRPILAGLNEIGAVSCRSNV